MKRFDPYWLPRAFREEPLAGRIFLAVCTPFVFPIHFIIAIIKACPDAWDEQKITIKGAFLPWRKP